MTELEMVRLNTRDQTAPYTFDDPTVISLLTHYNNDVNLVSSHLWLIRAGDASKRNFKFKAGDGREVDKTMQAKECREQATIFKDMAMLTPGDGIAEIEWTNAFDPPEGV
jgi:hypothetical protein